jgi:hypothetical protein
VAGAESISQPVYGRRSSSQPAQPLGYFGEARSRRKDAPKRKEIPQLRPCLGVNCNHMMLSTRANRICEKGRLAIANMVEGGFLGDRGEVNRSVMG